MEKFFASVLKHIKGWPWLLVLLAAGYCINAFLLLRLEENAIKLSENANNQFAPPPIINMANFTLNSTGKVSREQQVRYFLSLIQ